MKNRKGKEGIMQDYFQANQVIITKFFEEQRNLFELYNLKSSAEEQQALFMTILDFNKEIMLDAFQTQNTGLLSYINQLGSNLTAISSEEIQANEHVEERKTTDGNEAIELWLKKQISDVTGFPVEQIKETMKFEDDLGLVSIDMVAIFADFLESYPEYKVELTDIVSIATIKEFTENLSQFKLETN